MTETWLQTCDPAAPCTVIGEVAQAHDGSLGMAHAFIDAIAAAGADAVKFQTHIAEAESSPHEPWRKPFSPQDESRFDYWKRMEFSEDQWAGLRRHAEEKGLLFLSSPFSLEAVELLKRIGVAAWKIASGEITNTPLLAAACATGRPVVLSSGMSPLDEIDGAVAQVKAAKVPLALLQCASIYPTPPEAVGLNLLEVFKTRYSCAVGLSDHSATIFPGLGAALMGAQVLEVHVTLSREAFGPDVAASLTTAELAQLVQGVRYMEALRDSPVDKSLADAAAAPLREIFMKSLTPCRDLPSGHLLKPDDLTAKKPGTGIPVQRLDLVVGRTLARGVARDQPLTEDDLQPETS